MANRKVPNHMLERAPLSNAVRERLRRDLQNMEATAARKQLHFDAWDAIFDKDDGERHFELGCWLYYYSTRIRRPEAFQDRVDCARRIYLAGFQHLNYRFYTVFDFGEREYDTLAEMDDSAEVVDALRSLIPLDKTGNLAKAFAYNKWPLQQDEPLLLV
jgi:hypothetical protein